MPERTKLSMLITYYAGGHSPFLSIWWDRGWNSHLDECYSSNNCLSFVRPSKLSLQECVFKSFRTSSIRN